MCQMHTWTSVQTIAVFKYTLKLLTHKPRPFSIWELRWDFVTLMESLHRSNKASWKDLLCGLVQTCELNATAVNHFKSKMVENAQLCRKILGRHVLQNAYSLTNACACTWFICLSAILLQAKSTYRSTTRIDSSTTKVNIVRLVARTVNLSYHLCRGLQLHGDVLESSTVI